MSVYIKRPGQEEPELLASGSSNNGSSIDVQVIYEAMWPVGRGFIDFTDTDYSNWLGFTWERELVGMTAVGVDPTQTEFNEIGKTGGSKFLQKHSHLFTNKYGNVESGWSWPALSSYSNPYAPAESYLGTQETGEGNSGNLQPYKVVAYWKRVA